MTVRVNLLPPEIAAERRYRGRAVATALVLALFVVALFGVYWLKRGAVDVAVRERDAAQAEVDRREAELASLQALDQLSGELEDRNQVLAFAMADEISFARLFNDLSLTFPASSSLQSLSATLTPVAAAATTGEATETPAEDLDEDATIGLLSLTGYSVERYAPGVETLLLDLSRVGDLLEAQLTTASAIEIGDVEVTSFSGDAAILATARTGRYADGLPPEGLE